ncbi:MAG: hypothetical protein ACI4V4_06400 [Eubacterium sp.]
MNRNLVISDKPYHGIISNIKIDTVNRNGKELDKYTFCLLVEQSQRWIPVFVNEIRDDSVNNSTFQLLINNLCRIYSVDSIDLEEHIGLEVTISLFFENAHGNVYPKIKWYKPYKNTNAEDK